MVTEIMGILIVLGILLVLLVRMLSNKNAQEKEKNMQRSTEVLKKELERSGSTIIQRMGTHVSKLERLIREADDENRRLLAKLDEVNIARDMLQQQISEARSLQQQLAEQQRQLATAQAMYAVPTPMMMPPAPMMQPAVAARQQPQQENFRAVQMPQRNDFDTILQESIVKGETDEADYVEAASVTPKKASSPKVAAFVPMNFSSGATEQKNSANDDDDYDDEYDDEYEDEIDDEPITFSAQEKARQMLTEGKSVEDTARETGLGRGAIELMLQMIRRQ